MTSSAPSKPNMVFLNLWPYFSVQRFKIKKKTSKYISEATAPYQITSTHLNSQHNTQPVTELEAIMESAMTLLVSTPKAVIPTLHSAFPTAVLCNIHCHLN